MDTLTKIEYYKSKQKFVELIRGRGDFQETSRGYIIDYSSSFILMQATDDFTLNGYSIFPIDTILEFRHNKHHSFYDKVMKLEKLKQTIGISFSIDLSNWQSVFKSLKKYKLTITVECEEPHLEYFCIGSLANVAKSQVSMLYFSPVGTVDNQPTITKYINITKVAFGDRYANILTKYLQPEAQHTT